MEQAKKQKGVVIFCNISGLITKTINDESEIADCFPQGKLFSSCFPIVALREALDFMVAVKSDGSAHSGEMIVYVNNHPISLLFAGALIEDTIMLVASNSKGETEKNFS